MTHFYNGEIVDANYKTKRTLKIAKAFEKLFKNLEQQKTGISNAPHGFIYIKHAIAKKKLRSKEL
jgi:hypothetical protein